MAFQAILLLQFNILEQDIDDSVTFAATIFDCIYWVSQDRELDRLERMQFLV